MPKNSQPTDVKNKIAVTKAGSKLNPDHIEAIRKSKIENRERIVPVKWSEKVQRSFEETFDEMQKRPETSLLGWATSSIRCTTEFYKLLGRIMPQTIQGTINVNHYEVALSATEGWLESVIESEGEIVGVKVIEQPEIGVENNSHESDETTHEMVQTSHESEEKQPFLNENGSEFSLNMQGADNEDISQKETDFLESLYK